MPGQTYVRQVLVVDGDPHFVASILRLLQSKKFEGLTAQSSQSILRKAELLDIDMILIGENIPGADTFDLCKALKTNHRTGHIPIILLASSCESPVRIKGFNLGADDCVEKRVAKDELLVRMDAIWRRGEGVNKDQRQERQREVAVELSRIIDEGLVQPHFQPIYFLKPFRLFGLEILSRPIGSNIITNAEELFQSAEKYGMYYSLEMLCWKKAVDIVSMRSKNEHLFFNCSPYMVEADKFSEVKGVFEEKRIPFNKIILEITERSAISERGLFYSRLGAYRNEGFSFAVDDVGGGYASLESVVAAKPEVVKIDAHIIRDIHRDPVKRSVIKFIVAFCKENQIISVAEGVETKEELDVVLSLGVDAVQGFYLFRPTPNLNIREIKDVCVGFN